MKRLLFLLLPLLALPADAQGFFPAARPTPREVPAIPSSALQGEAPSAPDPGEAGRLHPGLENRLMWEIGQNLDTLENEAALEELNRLARYALEIERPDLFRAIMVAHFDPHWTDLSNARTALNMIAWLPDTADYLSPRITAARLAISEDELPEIEAQRLWRDLRARVERVGDPSLLLELAGAMIRSESPDLLVETVSRFHTTERDRLDSLVNLLQTHGPGASRPIAEMLYAEISRLSGDETLFPHSARRVAKAYWAIGKHEEALAMLEREPDALLRLRTRFELYALLRK